MERHLGFTATRGDLTLWQTNIVPHLLAGFRLKGYDHFHHGDCVGGDLYAAIIAYGCGYTIHCHPPINEHCRGWAPYHHVYDSLPYMERNNIIAQVAHAGIGVPNTETAEENPRSGTWATIRRFHLSHIPHWIVTPSNCTYLERQES